MPATGSSSSSSRGSWASAMPISRSATSPYERVPASRRASALKPTSSSTRSTFSRVPRSFAAERSGCRKRLRACAAIQMFSSTDSRLNTLLICKVRAMPRRLIWCGLRPPMSRPAENTRPASGERNPHTRLNSVVFPAPFGPMIACSRRGASARLTLSTATRPPKRLVSPSICKTGWLMAAGRPARPCRATGRRCRAGRK